MMEFPMIAAPAGLLRNVGQITDTSEVVDTNIGNHNRRLRSRAVYDYSMGNGQHVPRRLPPPSQPPLTRQFRKERLGLPILRIHNANPCYNQSKVHQMANLFSSTVVIMTMVAPTNRL